MTGDPLRMPADEFRVLKYAKEIAEELRIDPVATMTPEETERFRKALTEAAASGWQPKILSPRWPTPAEMRDFLAEHVTVVAPGETLIIRVPPDLTQNQLRDYQRSLDENFKGGFIPFRAVVVPGDELGVVRPPDGVTHACPEPRTGGVMPCCGQPPFGVPRTDRVTLDPDLVTCKSKSGD